MSNIIQIYLVSDSTGETVTNVSRSALAHFDDIKTEEHLWALVRTKGQIDKLVSHIQKKKGIVMFTIANPELQEYLRDICAKLQVLAITVLSEVVSILSSYLAVKPLIQPGRQHKMNEEYFCRINAINFALSHDDGQANFDLDKAEIIIVGPSRTSKSPTCMYLAYRGYKAANVPFIYNQKLAEIKEGPFMVGLTINPEVLIEIRKNRILNLKDIKNTNYVDYEHVKNEIREAKKFYQQMNWPTIDVTRKSVEETAANIIKLYEQVKLRN